MRAEWPLKRLSTDPPLVVDADALLPLPIAAQGFETVHWLVFFLPPPDRHQAYDPRSRRMLEEQVDHAARSDLDVSDSGEVPQQDLRVHVLIPVEHEPIQLGRLQRADDQVVLPHRERIKTPIPSATITTTPSTIPLISSALVSRMTDFPDTGGPALRSCEPITPRGTYHFGGPAYPAASATSRAQGKGSPCTARWSRAE